MKNKRITIYDIAKHADVSTATVSRYINKSGYVDKDTVDKVKKVIERLGYKPSMAAHSLKTKKSRLIVLIVMDIENPFYTQMAKQIQKLVSSNGYSLVLFNTNANEKDEIKAIEAASQMYASGIIHTSLLTDSLVEMLLDSEIPTVVANSYGSCPFDSVHGDRERSGAYIATEYLISSGHKHIAFAGGEKDTITGQSRLSGYIHGMERAGLEIRDEYISQNSFNQEGGHESGKLLLGMARLPTAVCCANDLIALGVMSAFRKAGVRIPEDVSVTGVDNIPYAALVTPPLTTVVNDSLSFSSASVDMLFERITGSYTEQPREVCIPRQLIIRQSVKTLA